jgi:hypothetical protein
LRDVGHVVEDHQHSTVGRALPIPLIAPLRIRHIFARTFEGRDERGERITDRACALAVEPKQQLPARIMISYQMSHVHGKRRLAYSGLPSDGYDQWAVSTARLGQCPVQDLYLVVPPDE